MLLSLVYSVFCEKPFGTSKELSLRVVKRMRSGIILWVLSLFPTLTIFVTFAKSHGLVFVRHFLPLNIEIRLSTLCQVCLVSMGVKLSMISRAMFKCSRIV